jgi:hypothetical protein
MMELFITLLPPLVLLFLGGLLLSDYAYRAGGTMEERRAVVFEVYRYAVCLVTLLMFSFTAFQLVGALVADAGNISGLSLPGAGAIISGLLFLAHWTMKNPALPKHPPVAQSESP